MLSEILFKDVVDIIKIPILIAEPVWQNENISDFEILYTNSEFKKSVADIKEKSMLNSIRTEFLTDVDFFGMSVQAIMTGRMFAETFFAEKTETWFSLEVNAFGKKFIVAALTDITAKVRYTEQLKLSLVTDTLTALPNRFQFYKEFNSIIDEAKDKNLMFGLIFFDIDNLKSLNDSKSQQAGDMVLIKAARIFKTFEKADVKIYRFGGDEFLVLAKNISYVDSLYTIGDAILEAFDAENINITGGISVFPDNTTEGEDLIKFADLAMHSAKKAGRHRILMFTPDMQKEFLRIVMFKSKMPKSFENGDFELFFQPQFDIASNKLRGFEALLRWHEPEIGSVSPDEFIPVAEETGFIKTLGTWVLEKAFTCQYSWEEKFDYDGIMSVNVSPVQLMDDDFLFVLDEAVRKTGVIPSHVEIEVTEGVLINDTEKAVAILEQVKAKGFRISLDDFGTGYSSLRYLQILPLTTLKIDKSFIQSITEKNGVSENITNAIISMVTKMGLDTIAEGVEKVDQLLILQELNCKTVQGFLRGKPMNQATIEDYLSGNKNALDYLK